MNKHRLTHRLDPQILLQASWGRPRQCRHHHHHCNSAPRKSYPHHARYSHHGRRVSSVHFKSQVSISSDHFKSPRVSMQFAPHFQVSISKVKCPFQKSKKDEDRKSSVHFKSQVSISKVKCPFQKSKRDEDRKSSATFPKSSVHFKSPRVNMQFAPHFFFKCHIVFIKCPVQKSTGPYAIRTRSKSI